MYMAERDPESIERHTRSMHTAQVTQRNPSGKQTLEMHAGYLVSVSAEPTQQSSASNEGQKRRRGPHVFVLEGAVEGRKLAELHAFMFHAGFILRLQEILDHLCCAIHVLLHPNVCFRLHAPKHYRTGAKC